MSDNKGRCPDRTILQQLVLGQLPGPDATPLEEHVEGCSHCAASLQGLVDDSFTQAVRTGAAAACRPDRSEVARLIDRLGDSPGTASPSPVIAFDQAQTPDEMGRVGPYRILGLLGAGGMGAVYLALDTRLGRRVALKMIQAGKPLGRERVARFRREAEVVARLQHDNIVHLFEAAEHEGHPYLAMEYVRGGSLAERLVARLLSGKEAARLVETLAGAVHYAHQEGVLHRDLKPANVLLSAACGRAQTSEQDGARPQAASQEVAVPKITDFGLARRLDQGPEGPATAYDTVSDRILGTPGYVAPEQVAGSGPVGPAADVYGLGAILYECLTGRPPFRAATSLETLELLRTRDPAPPRQLNPQVPRDLETICLKCLEREPGRRYPTAAALADDLGRFLAGEPIRARPTPSWLRAWKWARRRPTAAALLAFSGLAVLLLIAGLWWHTRALNAEVRKANEQRQRADRSYRHARQAMVVMLDRLGKFDAPGVPQVDALRRELNQDALAFFEGIDEDEATLEPAVRFDVAMALDLIGDLLRKQGQPEAAARKLRHALHLLEQLAAEDSANPDYQIELGRCLDVLATCLGRGAENLRCLERALAVRQGLCRREPNNVERQRAVAVSHTNVGVAYHDRGDFRTAEGHWREAFRIQKMLVRDHPGFVHDKELLAVSYSNLALVYSSAGRDAEAEPLLRKSVAVLDGLLRDHPDRNRFTNWNLAITLRIQGGFLSKVGRGEEGRAILTRAIDLAEGLREGDSHNPELKELVIACLAVRIYSCASLLRPQDAEKDWQRGFGLAAPANCWSELCKCPRYQAQFGAHALAAKWAQHLLRQKGIEGEDLYELVKAYGLAVTAAHDDRQLSTVEGGMTAERYAAEAMALLEKLRSQGFFKEAAHAKGLADDAGLKALRGRADFQRLLKDVKAAKK